MTEVAKKDAAMAEAEEILEQFRTGWAAFLGGRHGRPVDDTPRDYLWASRISDCARQMALGLMHPEEDILPVEAYERVDRGKRIEQALTARLQLAGQHGDFEVTGQQEHIEIRDRDGTKLCTGRIDGRIAMGKRSVPFEVKSGQSVQRVSKLEDLDESVWTENYIDQILIYCWAKGEPVGLLILDVPSGLTVLPIVVEDHMDRLEQRLTQMRAAIDARFGRAALPAPTRRKELCDKCPHYGRSCAPGTDYGAGLKVVADRPELEEELDKRARTKQDRKIYDKAHKKVRRMLDDDKFEILQVGAHQIECSVTRAGNKRYKFKAAPSPSAVADAETDDAEAA